jgi:hypothetical protein
MDGYSVIASNRHIAAEPLPPSYESPAALDQDQKKEQK